MASQSVPHSYKLTKRGLLCLSELNAWERESLPFINTPTGRDLYLTLARQASLNKESHKESLKALVLCQTDRAMRNRIREFERLELVQVLPSPTDARARVLQPTQKLFDMFTAHMEMLRIIFGRHFHFSRKSNS